MVRVNPGTHKFGRYGEAYADCASLGSIDESLKRACARRRAAEREIAWLTEIRERRQAQIDAGIWPACSKDPTPGETRS